MKSIYKTLFKNSNLKNFSDISLAKTPNLDPKLENQRLRQHLALSHRLFYKLFLHEGACSHLSVIAPAKSGKGNVLLITPGTMTDGGSLLWKSIKASDIIGISLEDGSVIEEGSERGSKPESYARHFHVGIRKINPEVKVLFHTHTPYVTALGCLKNPQLLPHQQLIGRLEGQIDYYDEFAQTKEEFIGQNIGKLLKNRKTNMTALFMVNHGSLIAADNIPLAFDLTYYLERICMSQILSMGAVNGDVERLKLYNEAQVQRKASFWNDKLNTKYANRHFYSYWREYMQSSECCSVFS